MDKFTIEQLKSNKCKILIFALFLLMVVIFIVSNQNRVKAAFVVAEVPPVNEYLPLDSQVPLIKINVTKFRTTKANLKKTIKEDNSVVDFYKKAYEKTQEYDYSESDDDGDI